MSQAFVRELTDLGRDDLEQAGGKGANLGELVRAGLPVPAGFVVLTSAYRAFVAETGIDAGVLTLASGPDGPDEQAEQIQRLFAGPLPGPLATQIRDAYAGLGDSVAVAVRSSATAEDLPEASFAGQQDTLLNVRGADAVLAAVRACWASLWNARAITYRERQGIDPAEVALAVVVQVMVEAEASGVMFTANPTDGRRDQVVIGAAWGLGEAVVSGLVDTDDLVLDKPSLAILHRRTADKQVMTGYGDQGTVERGVADDRRRAEVLSDLAAVELARIGVVIEDHFGSPQDIEWARADGRFAILQARPITTLPEVETPPPTDWSVPDPTGLYARASIVEQLPDPLTPLFAELGTASVSRSITAALAELMPGVVRPEDAALTTVNGFAYYYYRRSGLIRLTLRVPRALPMVVAQGPGGGLGRWRDIAHPRYRRAVAAWTGRSLAPLGDADLVAGIVELLDAGTEYYTAVQAVIPIAASSEVVLTGFYDRFVRRPGDPAASTFLLGFDSEPLRAEKSLYDLAAWADGEPALRAALLAGRARDLLDRLDARDDPPTVEWRRRFAAHLARYGHAVYNLDFANPVPADHPEPLLETVRFYLRDARVDPRTRQLGLRVRGDEATAEVVARLDPVRRAILVRLLERAQNAGPLREDALADVGLAWPQLRRMVLELGRRLVATGRLVESEEVFWLTTAEILGDAGGLPETVEDRRRLWRGRHRVTPPQLLPRGSWVEVLRRLMPAGAEDQQGDVLRGIAGSAGMVTGTARVLAGPADFGRLQPGDVLVAAITTPAWTTLFARAGGVVTDVGGPLSHSSIVAREYGIPAVLGTAVGTRRIRDGQRVRVDGGAGTVTLLTADAADDVHAPDEPEPANAGQRGRWLAAGVVVLVAGWLVGRIRRRRRA